MPTSNRTETTIPGWAGEAEHQSEPPIPNLLTLQSDPDHPETVLIFMRDPSDAKKSPDQLAEDGENVLVGRCLARDVQGEVRDYLIEEGLQGKTRRRRSDRQEARTEAEQSGDGIAPAASEKKG